MDENEAPRANGGLQEDEPQQAIAASVAQEAPTDRIDCASMLIRAGFAVLPLHTVEDGTCSCGEITCEMPGNHPLYDIYTPTRDPYMAKWFWQICPDADVGVWAGGDRYVRVSSALTERLISGSDRIERTQIAGAIVGPLVPVDFAKIRREGIPEIKWLREPYLPQGARVWAWGPTESAKSLWAQWIACDLTREGLWIAYFSWENPFVEDFRRLDRLRPDWRFLRFFHHETYAGDGDFDLMSRSDIDSLIEVCQGCSLIVLDTVSEMWSGDENESKAARALERTALKRIVRETGATVLPLHHTGHEGNARKAASRGRGSSAFGQKADVVLDFRVVGDNLFSIVHGKARMGGRKAAPQSFRIIDKADGGLTIEPADAFDTYNAQVRQCADAMVAAITTQATVTTKALRDASRGFGVTIQNDAIELLLREEPRRVSVSEEVITGSKGGRARAKVWRPANGD